MRTDKKERDKYDMFMIVIIIMTIIIIIIN